MKEKFQEGYEEWGTTGGQIYTIRIGYGWLIGQKDIFGLLLQCLSTIFWLMLQGRLLTRERLVHFSMQVSDINCGLCLSEAENPFFQCSVSQQALQEMYQWIGMQISGDNVGSIVHKIRGTKFRKKGLYPIFSASVYHLRTERCTRILTRKTGQVQSIYQQIRSEIKGRVAMFLKKKLKEIDRCSRVF